MPSRPKANHYARNRTQLKAIQKRRNKELNAILTEIITILTGGITGIASGIGQGLGELTRNIFLAVNEQGAVTGLSVFGSLIVVFAGISLAIGLCRWVVNWVTSLGN